MSNRDTKPENVTLSPEQICHRSTWCSAPAHNDDTPCVIAPKRVMEVNDYGPERAKARRW